MNHRSPLRPPHHTQYKGRRHDHRDDPLDHAADHAIFAGQQGVFLQTGMIDRPDALHSGITLRDDKR
jgi:hypothetical protein